MQGNRGLNTFLLAVALAAAATVVASNVRAQGAGRAGPGNGAPMPPAFRQDAGQIGVSIRNLGADDLKNLKLTDQAGVLVEAVQPNSPASAAGLRANDVIVEFDGERVRSARQLSRLVLETPPGRHVKVGVMRDGRRSDLEVTPAQAPPGVAFQNDDLQRALEGIGRWGRDMVQGFGFQPGPGMGMGMRRARLGVVMQPLSPDLASYFGVKNGVLVSSVANDSPAAKAGLKAGDVITAVDGRSVANAAELTGAMGDPNTSREVTLTVVRDKKPLTLKAQLAGSSAPQRVPGRGSL